MLLTLSCFAHLLGSLLLFLASEKADYRRGELAKRFRAKRPMVVYIGLVLFLTGTVLAYREIGFAASIFFSLVVIMTFLSCLLLFVPLIFKPIANARK